MTLGVDGMTLFGWIFKNILGVPEVHWSVSGYCEFVGFCEEDNKLYDPQNSGNN